MTAAELLKAYEKGKRDFGGAYLRGAYLRGADLREADLGAADLRGADLRGADLRGADLGGADLGGADLGEADLGEADLGGADLGGADLFLADLGDQWVVQGATRSDGYQFLLTNLTEEGVRLKAGCRNFTIAEAIKHWTVTRGGTRLGDETYAIINHLVELAFLRGLIDENCEPVKK